MKTKIKLEAHRTASDIEMKHCNRAGQPFILTLLLAISAANCSSAVAAETMIAAASNFRETALEIGTAFEMSTGHRAVYVFGSTGHLYAQITQGAPFDVFLAADQTRPQRAARDGHGQADSIFTYAIGKLVLYSTDENVVHGRETLDTGTFARIAIADPITAPYGAATAQAMSALGVLESLEPRIVQGKNIAQAYQFVATGNVELGFVALSQVRARKGGSRWIVPESLYDPIAQDAILLDQGADNEAAKAYMRYLGGPQARLIIERGGYATTDTARENP